MIGLLPAKLKPRLPNFWWSPSALVVTFTALSVKKRPKMMKFWWVITLFCLRIALSAASEPQTNLDSNAWMGRVLIVGDPAATIAFAPQPEPIRHMVENGMIAFTRKPDEKS